MDNLKYKLYASWFIFPISLLVNVKLQRMFPNSFGGKRFYNFLIDMVWWTATTYLMVLMNEQLPREPNFQQIKDSLLAQQNPEYLLHMHENYSKYKIEYADQIGKHRPYTNPQILNLSWKARDLAQ